MEAQTTGRWLSVFDAAQAMGVSEGEVRRQAAYNLLRRRPGVGRLEVWVPWGATPVTSQSRAPEQAAGSRAVQLELFAESDEVHDDVDAADADVTDLARQQAAHAAELVALARHEARRLRQHLAGAWAVAGLLMLMSVWSGGPPAAEASSLKAVQDELTEIRQRLDVQLQDLEPGRSTAMAE